MADPTIYPLYGQQRYTMIATDVLQHVLLLNGSIEITFAAANFTTLQPGPTGELLLTAGGRVYIPDALQGNWKPEVIVDCSAGALMKAQIDTLDNSGNPVGSQATTDYPAVRSQTLLSGTGTTFTGFRQIGHVASTGDVQIKLTLIALAAATVTRVQLAIARL